MSDASNTSLIFLLPLELFRSIATTCVSYYYHNTNYDEYYHNKRFIVNRSEEISLGGSLKEQFRCFLEISDWLAFDAAITNHRQRQIYLSCCEGGQLFAPTQYLSGPSLRWIQKRKLRLINLYLSPFTLKEMTFCFIDLSMLKIIVIPTQSKEAWIEALAILRQLQLQIHFIGFEKNQNVNISHVKKISKCCRQLRFLALYSCKHINDLSIHKLSQFQMGKDLLELNLSKSTISNNGLQAIAQNLKKLKSLDISYCRVSYAMIGEVIRSTQKSLLELTIDYVEYSYPTLSEATLQLHSLFQLISTLGNQLLLLSIRGCGRLSDDSLLTMINHCHGLKQINLTECFSLTDHTLIEISRSLGNLSALDVRDCFKFTDDGILPILRNCHQLIDVAVDGCYHLSPLILLEADLARSRDKRILRLTYTQCPKLGK